MPPPVGEVPRRGGEGRPQNTKKLSLPGGFREGEEEGAAAVLWGGEDSRV